MASSDYLTSKHQKFENKDADLLNDVLPEHVVSRILSLLPTKEAIKTSILSKRWRFLWTTISNLDFPDYNEGDLGPSGNWRICHDAKNRSGVNRKKFIRYVNRVLRRLDPSNSIDKLSISFKVYPNVLELKKWVSSAAKRNIKDLTLSVHIQTVDSSSNVPRKVFGCKSLEALTLSYDLHMKIPKRGFVSFPNLKFLALNYIHIYGIPDEKNSPCFPKLKKLCLNMVRYNGKDDCVMKLIRNCPLLEDLSIHRYFDRKVSNVDLCIPQLTTIDLHCEQFSGIYGGLNIQIEAAVKSLKISLWNPTYIFILKNPDSLVEAELTFEDLEKYDFKGEQRDGLLKLFKTVDKVKCLRIPIFKNNAIIVGKIKLPLFVNLTRLVVVLYCKDMRMLEGFLNSANKLQVLVIQKNNLHRECIQEDQRWTKLSHVPKCMISSLKKVDIVAASDCPCELDTIKTILESAKVLEKLTTKTFRKTSSSFDLDSRHRLISQLQRASASCQFDILPR